MTDRLGLSADAVVLPKGTRVVLRCDLRGDDGHVFRAASLATVDSVVYNTYRLETPSGRTLTAQRDQITVQRRELLRDLGVRQWDYGRLARTVIYSSVVGSRAWGLDGPDSDEDVRGVFVAPFDDVCGLWQVPAEIHDPHHEHAYWEIGRFVTQGLKGDANTLEALWSPLHKVVTPLGEALLAERRMFVSMNILGSFGRYAQSQFKKIERTRKRHEGQVALVDALDTGRVHAPDEAVRWLSDALGGAQAEWRAELKAMLRSLHDQGLLATASFADLAGAVAEGRAPALRPAPFRPKNAYNLLRLLYSCRSWLTTGEPLIRVQGPERDVLLEIKNQLQPIEATLALARSVAAEVDAAAKGARLPSAPDYARADAFLRRCRRAAARRALGARPTAPATEAATGDHDAATDEWVPRRLPVALPADVDAGALRAFLDERIEDGRTTDRRPLWVGLTGAHAYGFPSPDSDLDLKGVHAASASSVLVGRRSPSHEYLGEWHGRELDYTTNELAGFVARLVAGNGNALEQLLGPYAVLTTEGGHALAEWAKVNVSSRSFHHYRGFMNGIRREYAREAERGVRKAKRLLYGYRVGLTGIHLLRTATLVMDVGAWLNDWPRIAELLAVKRDAELGQLPTGADDAPFLQDLDSIERALVDAHEHTALPAAPPDIAGLERLQVALRF